jgi:hypothetical protein
MMPSMHLNLIIMCLVNHAQICHVSLFWVYCRRFEHTHVCVCKHTHIINTHARYCSNKHTRNNTRLIRRASEFRPADSNSSGYWQMVCVGMRAWAWKTLMVKTKFFDALAKVMTRSSVQLSLYGPMRIIKTRAYKRYIKETNCKHN